MLKNISILILAFNEGKNIGRAISSSVAVAKKIAGKYEIIVVYYAGSTDNTESVVKAMASRNKAIRIVYQPVNRKGCGIGLRMGIDASRYDYVFFTDGDNQFSMEELPMLLPYLERYDIVSGFRRKRHDPFGRVLSAKLYNFLLWLLLGLDVRDVDSAFKIFKKKIFKTFELHSVTGLITAEILIKAKNRGFKLKEIPVHHYPRIAGCSNYGRNIIKLSTVLGVFKEMKLLWHELRMKK